MIRPLVEGWRGERWFAQVQVSLDLNVLLYGAALLGLLTGPDQSLFPYPRLSAFPTEVAARATDEWPDIWRETVDAHGQAWRSASTHFRLVDGMLFGSDSHTPAAGFPSQFPAWVTLLSIIRPEFTARFQDGSVGGDHAIATTFFEWIGRGPRHQVLKALSHPLAHLRTPVVCLDLVFKDSALPMFGSQGYLVVGPQDLNWPDFQLPARLVDAVQDTAIRNA